MEKILYLTSGILLLVAFCRADCQKGYQQIREDECRDINECSDSSERKCGQLCANEPGTFRCGCLTGYILADDNTSCVVDGPDPVIYFRRRKDIARIDPSGQHAQVAVRRVGSIKSFDIHMDSETVYWIDGRGPSIGMTPLNQGGRAEVFNLENLKKPESLKVDWIGQMIYWTDSKAKAIVRCSMNGTNQETVLTSQKKPKALVLDPIDRFVFWSTSGKSARIHRADFDGGTREVIVRDELEAVVSLDVDIIDKRLYWLDQNRGKIESVQYQGSDRKVLVRDIGVDAIGLSLLADSIYWLSTQPASIHRADIRTGRRQIRLRSDFFLPGQSNLVVMHRNKQPIGQFYKGNCSSWNSCPNFPHEERASRNQPFVLFTTNSTVQRINQDGSKHAYTITKSSYNLVGVDYDVRKKRIFFADAGKGVIESASLDGSDRRVIVGHNDIETVEGIALDWMHRQIYWTDSSLRHVAASSSQGGSRRIVTNVGVFQPRGITVHSVLNWVYWTDLGYGSPKIVASLIDGTVQRDIITEGLMFPNSITIDFVRNKLLWVDYGLAVIEESTLEGMDKTVLYRLADSGVTNIQPHSLAVSGKYLWFTNWADDMVVRVDQRDNNNIMDIRGDDIWRPTGITVVRNGRIPSLNPCEVFNGLCDHICVLAAENQAACSCNPGYQIAEDARTCLLIDPCSAGDEEELCGRNAHCLSNGAGDYTCLCKRGYEHNENLTCIGIKDELEFVTSIARYPSQKPAITPTTLKTATPTMEKESSSTPLPQITTHNHVTEAASVSVTSTVISTTMEEHLDVCPPKFKTYCLNGGKCSWIVSLNSSSCSCTSEFVGERCEYTRSLLSRFLENPVAVAVSGGVLLPICCIFFLLGVCLICRRLSWHSSKCSNPISVCTESGNTSTDLFLRRSSSYHQRRDMTEIPVYHPPRNNIRMQTIDRSSFHVTEPHTTNEHFSTFPRRSSLPSANNNSNNVAPSDLSRPSSAENRSPSYQLVIGRSEITGVTSGYEDMSRGSKARKNSRKDTSSYISMDDSSLTVGHDYSSTIEQHYSHTLV